MPIVANHFSCRQQRYDDSADGRASLRPDHAPATACCIANSWPAGWVSVMDSQTARMDRKDHVTMHPRKDQASKAESMISPTVNARSQRQGQPQEISARFSAKESKREANASRRRKVSRSEVIMSAEKGREKCCRTCTIMSRKSLTSKLHVRSLGHACDARQGASGGSVKARDGLSGAYQDKAWSSR